MAQWQDLSAEQGNDVLFTLHLTYNGAAFNPTNYTLTLYLKASETTADASATTFTVGAGLTVVNAARGEVTWACPHTSTGTPGQEWWRIDAVDTNSQVSTLMLGNFYVQAV